MDDTLIFLQVKKVEETLKKVKNEFQSRPQKKATDFTNKVQLKKMVDELEKEIGLLFKHFHYNMKGILT